MSSLEELARVLSVGDNQKLMIPNIGHRMVSIDSSGKVTDGQGNDFTDAFKSPIQEEAASEENGDRTSAAELAEKGISEVASVNSIILRGNETMKAFTEMKRSMFNDVDIDNETIEAMNSIESFIGQTVSKYLEKKEMIRASKRITI